MFTHASLRYGVIALAMAGLLGFAPAASSQTALRDSVPVSLKRDYERSQTLWVDLAESGDPRAQTSLGFLYYVGLWLDQNDRQAFNWFESAAVQGVPEAQYYLGSMYLRGRGIPNNPQAAYFWCELASTTGKLAERSAAFSCREEAGKSLSAEEIRSAGLRVKSWTPTTRN